MRSMLITVAAILCLTVGAHAYPLHSDSGSGVAGPCRQGVFYCQAADHQMLYNISSGFDAEMADDIPEEWAGYTLEGVTLWMGEWFSVGGPTWRDPLGVRISFYHESCPPEMDGFLSLEVSWQELEKTLVYNTGGMTVYEVTAWLPAPLTVEAGMSLGATALIDWGHDEPFTGICATPMGTSHGACVCYLDATWWGYDRWTAIDHHTGISQDMGFCLHGGATAVAAAIPLASTRLSVRPNPFNPATTLSFRLAADGPARLTLHDLAGRQVRVLAAGWQAAGEHMATWRGRNESGDRVAAGVYFVRLETGGGAITRKLVLVE